MITQAAVVLLAACALLAAVSWALEAGRPKAFVPRDSAFLAGAAALACVAFLTVLPTAAGTPRMPFVGGAMLVGAAALLVVGAVGVLTMALPRGGLAQSLVEGVLIGSSCVAIVWSPLAGRIGHTVPRPATVVVMLVLASTVSTVLRMPVSARGFFLEGRHRDRLRCGVLALGLVLVAAVLDVAGSSVPPAVAALVAAVGFAVGSFAPWVGDRDLPPRTRPSVAGLVLPYVLVALAAVAVGVQVGRGRADAVTGALVVVVGLSLVAVQLFAVRAGDAVLSDLEISRQRLEALVENAQDVILGLDLGGRVIAGNAAVERLLGSAPGHVVGRDVAEVAVLDDRPAVRQVVRDVVLGRRPSAKVELRLAPPGEGTAEMRLRGVDGGAVAVLSDITEAVTLREKLSVLARHDRMTGLVNREVVLETVGAWLHSADPVSVLYCDLDGYKAVNDRFGHSAGDDVLVEVAQRLRTAVAGIPAAEAVLGRIGGDEFVVALRGVHGRDAVAAGERLVAAMRPTFDVGDRTVRLGISVGVSGTDDAVPLPRASGEAAGGPDGAAGPAGADGEADSGMDGDLPADGPAAPRETPAAELLHRGDLAMFAAKATGRARVARWDPDVSERALRRVDIAIGLWQALDAGSLALAYQPLVRLSDGVVVGVEALIRVERATDDGPGALSRLSGFVSPAELVEVAEDTGEIAAVGKVVLRQATLRAAFWHALGHDLFVAVNMSVRQMSEAGFVDTVRRALDDSGLPADKLVVEITEGQLVGEEDPVRGVIEELRADGVAFVIDDFGTGYSSLSYLKTMPVRAIKLDRTLLDGIDSDDRAHTLARGVVDTARRLGLAVVAEGLESLDAARTMRDLGAWAGQGFALHPPLRDDELVKVLTASPLDLGGRARRRVVDVTDAATAGLSDARARAGRHLGAAPADPVPTVPAEPPSVPTPVRPPIVLSDPDLPDPPDLPDDEPVAPPPSSGGAEPSRPSGSTGAAANGTNGVHPAGYPAPHAPAPPTPATGVLRVVGDASGPLGEAPRFTGGAGGVGGVVLPPRVVSDGETGPRAD